MNSLRRHDNASGDLTADTRGITCRVVPFPAHRLTITGTRYKTWLSMHWCCYTQGMSSGQKQTSQAKTIPIFRLGASTARVLSLRDCCPDFPAYLLDVTDEVVLCHIDMSEPRRDYRVGIFLDTRDNTPVVAVAYGLPDKALRFTVLGSKRRTTSPSVADITLRANNHILYERQKGYRVAGNITKFFPVLIKKEITRALSERAI